MSTIAARSLALHDRPLFADRQEAALPGGVSDAGLRSFTVADLACMPAQLPSGPVLWELDNGKPLAMNPPGNLHGSVEAQFTGRLLYEGELKRHGKVRCGEVGIVLRREPQARVVGADVVFIASRSLPIKESPEGYLETIPDLVVEVRSKNYADNFVAQRVADYLAAGVAVVWVVDPRTKSVSVHLPHAEPRLFQGDDVLEAEDIVPGMRIRVRDVFEE